MADCAHKRRLTLTAKCSDCCMTTFPSGAEHAGYVPSIAGIGGGDYIDIVVCIDCHTLLNFSTQSAERAEQDHITSLSDPE